MYVNFLGLFIWWKGTEIVILFWENLPKLNPWSNLVDPNCHIWIVFLYDKPDFILVTCCFYRMFYSTMNKIIIWCSIKAFLHVLRKSHVLPGNKWLDHKGLPCVRHYAEDVTLAHLIFTTALWNRVFLMLDLLEVN